MNCDFSLNSLSLILLYDLVELDFTERFFPVLFNEYVEERVSLLLAFCTRRAPGMRLAIRARCGPGSAPLAFSILREHREGCVFSGKNLYSCVLLWDTELTLFFSH